MDKKTIKEIVRYKKDLKKMGYDLNNIFLILNENKFKRKKFTFLGFSVIYSNIKTPYKFMEFKTKKLPYNFIRRVERNVNYRSR